MSKKYLHKHEKRVVSLWSLLAEAFKIASQYVQDAQFLLQNLQQLLLACFYLKPVLRKTVFLAPVVQTLDSAVLWINHYPADKHYGNQ